MQIMHKMEIGPYTFVLIRIEGTKGKALCYVSEHPDAIVYEEDIDVSVDKAKDTVARIADAIVEYEMS